MGWVQAIQAFFIALPKLADEFRALREAMEKVAQAAQDRKAQEALNEQRIVQLEVERAANDEQLARLARRLSDLEQRRV